ncbi:MAG TPA: EAL domain-containing protein [Solimonas sp.]
MSVKTKFLLVMIVVNCAILVAGLLIVPSLRTDRTIEDGLRGRANRISMAVVMNEALMQVHREAEIVARDTAAGVDASQPLLRLRQAQNALLNQARFLSGGDAARAQGLRELLEAESAQIDALIGLPPVTPDAARAAAVAAGQMEARAGRELAALLEDNNSRGLNDALTEVGDLKRRLATALGGVAGALALSLLLTWFAFQRLIQPLGSVTGALNAVLTGRQPARRLEETPDELGDIVRAIHKLQAQADHIRRVAFVDAGSGLPNRNRLDAELREVRRLRPIDGTHGLILLGVDTYESVRSGYGFRIAEWAMRAAADRFHALDQLPTQVFRLESDILALLIDRGSAEAVTRADLKRVAAEAMSRLGTPVEVEAHQFLLATSAGAALFPDDARDAEEYISVCVDALRRARAEGVGHLRFGERGHMHRLRKHLALAEQIRVGMRQGQFVPYFQPIVDVLRRKVVGAEILVRWRQPDGRVVLPSEFINLVESSELIREMTRAVLVQACRTVRGWSDRGYLLSVSFNLSPKLLSPGILDITRDALQDSGLPAAQLMAEVTETALVGNLDDAVEVLSQLRQQGVRLCLDDFGTGYSSLSHLYRFQVDRIKIDPVITRAAVQMERAGEIVRSMADLAGRIGISIVAEGIENETDLECMRRLGCAVQQGFFYSRAMPEEQFIEWARRFEAGAQAA